MAIAASPEDDELFLPPLREDLNLLPAENDEYGAPSWTIHDPVRNRYFRIGFATFEMLRRWSSGRASVLLDNIRKDTVLTPDTEDVRNLIRFLHGNGLLVRVGEDAVAEFGRIARAGKPPLWKWLIHNYLFIRIPLVRPDRFLEKTRWIADFFANRVMQILIVVVGLIGIIMTVRQWDAFWATFIGFANWQGAVWLAVTLSGVKILHELGHAYTAKRYGCRIPTMGLAFLVMYPVLYTDTSDAWRLTQRNQKLRIASAGIRVELCIALLATFFWHILPNGPARSAVFLLASATWITTLLINLSPFMRFDGYYLLSDFLRVPNLQPRAFAMTKWYLRELLFGLHMPPPEPFSLARRRVLILYSVGVWIYRFFLFLGIALIVYHLFFKLLGIVLFSIEICWFILLPIFNELRVWWKVRREARVTPLSIFVILVLSGGVLALFVPWQETITGAAQLQAAAQADILTPVSGKIIDVEVKEGDQVAKGEVLVRMDAPELSAQQREVALQLKEAEIRLAQARSDPELQDDVASSLQEVLRLKANHEALEARARQLVLHAPIGGVVRDVDNMIRKGIWIGGRVRMMRIIDEKQPKRVIAYVSQRDVSRLQEASSARFYPDELSNPIEDIRIDRIDSFGAAVIEPPSLTTANGGPIAARADSNGNYVPLDAVYRISGYVVNRASARQLEMGMASGRGRNNRINMTQRGTLEIAASAASLAWRIYQSVASLAIRQLSF